MQCFMVADVVWPSKAALVCLPAKPVRICCVSALQEGPPAHQYHHVAPRLKLLKLSSSHFQGALTLTLSSPAVPVCAGAGESHGV